MGQLTGHEVACQLRERIALRLVEEGVVSLAGSKYLSDMQPRAGRLDGLGHEADAQPSAPAHYAQRPLQGDQPISGGQRVLLRQIDLILARAHLVMRRFDLDSE